VVKGNCSISGDITGGGILVVTGKLNGNRTFLFNGLILAVGRAKWIWAVEPGAQRRDVRLPGDSERGSYTFGTPKYTLAGTAI